MKNKLYIILPISAFVIILLNAFFGHLVFESPYDQDINKYSIYVHLQPEWRSYPGNMMFDVTTVWDNPNSIDQHLMYYDSNIDVQKIKEHNFNQLQNIRNKTFVELKHEYSHCELNWKPILYRYGIDMVRNKIETIQGIELSGDPYASVYPLIKNQAYDDEFQDNLLQSGYLQFIPICTSKEYTDYKYSIRINDYNKGFDVFFVPSKSELKNYAENFENFTYYQMDGCFGKNYQSFNGFCENVSSDSGLLIIMPDDLTLSLTRITVNLHEIE